MKKDFVVVSSLLLVLVMALVLTMVTYAQEPEQESREELRQEGEMAVEEIGGAGLADPPTAGYTVLYMFSGVANDVSGPDFIATVFHCTNYGSADLPIRVELFHFAGGNADSLNFTVQSNRTATFMTQNTAIYVADVNMVSPDISQGSGRILSTGSTLICTVQLVDPDDAQPSFMVKLPLFDRYGNLVGSTSKIYLPIIMKST